MLPVHRFPDVAGELNTHQCFVSLANLADLRPCGLHELLLVFLHDPGAEAGDDTMRRRRIELLIPVEIGIACGIVEHSASRCLSALVARV